MYCENCGKLIENSARFCTHCGTKVDGSVYARIENAQRNVNRQVNIPKENTLKNKGKIKEKNPKWGLIIAAIVVIAAALAVLIGFGIYNRPENRLARALDLGQKYLLEEDYEQAIVEFTKAIEIDSNCADAYMGRGKAYEGLGGSEENIAAALADYEMALEIDETITEAYIRIADIYIRMEQYDKAKAILQKGLKKAADEQLIVDKLDDISYSEVPEAEENELVTDEIENIEEDIPEDIPDTENVINIHSVTELENIVANGASNCTLMLDGKDYDVGWGLYLNNLENVVIQGTEGTRLLGDSEEDTVVEIYGSKGLTLKNLVIGHDIPVEMSCTWGVLDVYESEIFLINCDLFGCGQSGFYSGSSMIEAEDCVIRDCSEYIMDCYETTATFKRCTFSRNGYREPRAYAINTYESGSALSFSDCTFDSNYNPTLLNNGNEETVTFDTCSFSNNAWD